MTDEPDKPKGGSNAAADGGDPSADGEEKDRPTVSPPFDPVAFARDAFKPSPAPMNAVKRRPSNDAHSRATPAHGIAQPARPPVPRRKTPTSTISLLNARIPSELPPRPGEKKVEPPVTAKPPASPDEFSDFDQPTRPPPADGPTEDPFLEVSDLRASQVDQFELEVDSTRRPAPEAAPATRGEQRPAREPELTPAQAMNARIELGDYSGALEIAEDILATDPTHLSARTCAETCRSVLRQMYAARIGPLDGVPVVMVPRDQLRWLSIDHKAGFVLSLVDGVSNFEMIIDVSGMPELDTLRILSELAQQRIISLR